jgi:hypothetical protein
LTNLIHPSKSSWNKALRKHLTGFFSQTYLFHTNELNGDIFTCSNPLETSPFCSNSGNSWTAKTSSTMTTYWGCNSLEGRRQTLDAVRRGKTAGDTNSRCAALCGHCVACTAEGGGAGEIQRSERVRWRKIPFVSPTCH